MMKVCHFITYYLPVTQNWIYNQLVRNDECRPVVLCQRLIDREQFPLEDVYPICQSKGAAATAKRLTHKITEQYPRQPHLSVIDKFKPDILHGHFLLESWRNYRLIKSLNIPLVTTCYGQDVTSLPRKPFWAARCKKVFELGGAFIAEGRHMGETLANLGCPKEKIHIVKLGIDTAKIGVNTDKKNDGSDNTVRILFTGLNREKKGAVYAVRAFIKSLSIISDMKRSANGAADINLELHLLGDGIYRGQCEKTLTDANVRDRAVFHGMKPVDQYRELLKSIDMVLTPSVSAADGDTEGGAPVAAIEALCAGIPVAGSNHCDIPNIVSHGVTGLLSNERDADALAKNIVTLATNKPLRIDMGKKGAKYARAEHDIAKQVKKITGVYKSVIPRQ